MLQLGCQTIPIDFIAFHNLYECKLSENSAVFLKFNPTAVMRTPEVVLIKTWSSDNSFAIVLSTSLLKTGLKTENFLTTFAAGVLSLDVIISSLLQQN